MYCMMWYVPWFIKKGEIKMEMNIYLYIILFVMGTVFGSFYTLAVYRIPKNIDIIKKHSYCPNCNHKLGFFELIPIFSYIFLGGKCKNCKQKIRIRYLLLEVLSGISFVVLGLSIKLNIYTINIQTVILYVITILYFTAIVLISGIDKEYRKIDKRLLTYGIIVSLIYMIYLYTVEITNIYRYAIYLAIYVILLCIDTFFLKKKAKDSYILDILILLTIILSITNIQVFAMTTVMTIISILIYMMIRKMYLKKRGNIKPKLKEVPIGFFIGASNIIVIYGITIIRMLEQ